MKFPTELKQGHFLKRYKRFFVDIEFNGEVITAHCPNTGSMKGVNTENSPCRFSHVDDPKRKLKYTLEMIKTPESWVGVNTSKTNKLAAEAIAQFHLKQWKNFNAFASEVKINDKSRMDFVLWNTKNFSAKKPKIPDLSTAPFHFIEVKNVSLAEEGVALFPDAVTERGQKHIEELIKLMEQGHSAEMLYIVQREDCNTFRAAHEIDPTYASLLKQAKAKGLIVTAIGTTLTTDSIELNKTPMKESISK